MQVIEYDLFQLLVNLLLFPEDNVALAFNSGLLELRVLQDVGHNVDGGGHILAEALGVVHGLFARGVRVQVRAEVLDLELERVLRAPVRALERHVLEEVRSAVVGLGLGARAGVDPHADGRRLCMRVRLCGDC